MDDWAQHPSAQEMGELARFVKTMKYKGIMAKSDYLAIMEVGKDVAKRHGFDDLDKVALGVPIPVVQEALHAMKIEFQAKAPKLYEEFVRGYQAQTLNRDR